MVLSASRSAGPGLGHFEAKALLRPGNGSRVILGNVDRKCIDGAEVAISWVALHCNKLSQYNMGTSCQHFMTVHQDIVVQAWDCFHPYRGPSGSASIALATLAATLGCELDETCGVTGVVAMNGNLMPCGDIEAKAKETKDLGLKKLNYSYRFLSGDGSPECGR